MGEKTADEMILSYNDVVLRRSDLDILNGRYFLNDRIIEFYFNHISSHYPSEKISLVSPSIAFYIANCPGIDTLNDFISPLNLTTKELILFPVNDNDDVSLAEGGSHWSLLVYVRKANVFVHHDSFNGLNASYAQNLYRAVVGHVGGADIVSKCTYIECDKSPQQKNWYDCGVYVLAIAKAICEWYIKIKPRVDDELWYSVVNNKVDLVTVAHLRCEILWLITSLMDKK